MVSLARTSVRGLLVEYGLIAERFLFQLIFAVGLVLVGVFFCGGALIGALPVKAVYCAPAIGFGAWMIHHLLERGFVVKVTTNEGDTRKLRLGKEQEHASAFIAEARKLGWTVENIGALSR